MRIRLPLLCALLAARVVLAQGQTLPSPPKLGAVVFDGGSGDDLAFAQAAFGLKVGDPADPEAFQMGLAAVRATDRFRAVEGRLEEGPQGPGAWIHLEPWPEIKSREFRGDLPKALRDSLFTGMHKGGRAGDLRLARWEVEGAQRLREAGYPEARVKITREEAGARLVIDVQAGPPALVRTLAVEGDRGPYAQPWLERVMDIHPGKTIWNDAVQRNALLALRQRLVKDQRLQATADFAWDPAAGRLVLKLGLGPVVELRQEGRWSFWWKNLSDLVPLARAGSYSPELLDEGDRRILSYLRDQGYLDAQVSHRQEVLKGTAESPQEVAITYRVAPGEKFRIDAVKFERNQEFSEAELEKASGVKQGFSISPAPLATPGTITSIEDRLKDFYWSQGYPDVALRRPPMARKGGKNTLVFQVREGTRQTLDRLVLELPADPSWQPWTLGETLPLIFSDKLDQDSAPDLHTRIFLSDRPQFKGVQARLEEHTDPAKAGVRTFTLTTSRPLPFVKNDLAAVYTALRQRLTDLGVQRPTPKLQLEPGEGGYTVRLEVTEQPRVAVKRLVVQGSDYTQARAVLREADLVPGAPLSPDRLSRAQGHLGGLGAFQGMDLQNLGDNPAAGDSYPWEAGDLLLVVDERPPWALSSSFGYDKSQGYHIGLGAQRNNLWGMGRTLDFNIRAGDTTINNPTLRKWFPTGQFNRSVDSYSIGYTDPWFLPGALRNLLSPRTQYRAEAAYIEDTQAAFLAHRRRITNTFDWKIGDYETVQLGHRYERTDISANAEGIDLNELFTLAGVPGPQTVISAPFLQITVDRRDHPLDPRRGTLFVARLEMANQLFGTGPKYSFVKLDVRHQWNWPVGEQGRAGVFMAAARIGLARPTAASVDDLPLAERFFAGGPFTVRGVEPDFLGPVGTVGTYDNVNGTLVRTGSTMIPLGGQALVVINLEYRFPFFGSDTVWGEIFVDSGQVYAKLNPDRQPGDPAPFPPLRTTLGAGLILRLGLPIKFEYATDLKRILGQPRTQQEIDTALRGLLVSAGYQF